MIRASWWILLSLALAAGCFPDPAMVAGDRTAQSGEEVVLHSDSFWRTSGLSAALQAEIASLIASMDSQLKSAALNDADRALQLQWALKVANELSAASVVLLVAPGRYDFSGLAGSHPSTPDTHAVYLPKLFVNRDRIQIAGRDPANQPILTYQGAGADGVNHGRVLLMIKSGLKAVTIEDLQLRGDHATSSLEKIPFYLHENNAALKAFRPKDRRYGLLMIGMAGGPNDTRVSRCTLDAINLHGIKITGNATIADTKISGIIPMPTSDNYVPNILDIQAQLSQPENLGPIGMAFQSGIEQRYNYGDVMKVERSELSNLIEGVVAGAHRSWKISDNTFSVILDHAIYLLGSTRDSLIADNHFERVYSSVIKLGGQSATHDDPLVASTGAWRTTIEGNHFALLRHAALALSGSFNTIRDNTITTYSRASDPTGGYYDPARKPSHVSPDFWISTYGGNAGYSNPTAFNAIINNSRSAGLLTVLLQQSRSARDQSISYNRVEGKGQHVFFQARKGSRFAPIVLTRNVGGLTIGGPANCADCYPDHPTYRTTIRPEWIRVVHQPSENHVLVKFVDHPDIFALGDSGSHLRVNTGKKNPIIDTNAFAAGDLFEILAVADLDGDGSEEVYSRRAGGTKLYGAERLDKQVSLPQWYFYNGSRQLTHWTTANIHGTGLQLLTAFDDKVELYGSRIPEGQNVHRIGPVLYSAAGQLTSLAAADTATRGEQGSDKDELFLGLSDARVLAVLDDHGALATVPVYSGKAILAQMTPANLYGDAKQEVYHLFGNAQTAYYTGAPGKDGLPLFATAGHFFSGHPLASMIAADLDNDGKDEIYTKFVESPTIYQSSVSGGPTAFGAAVYSGSYHAASMARYKADGKESLLTIFSGLPTIYRSRSGAAICGSNHLQDIYAAARKRLAP